MLTAQYSFALFALLPLLVQALKVVICMAACRCLHKPCVSPHAFCFCKAQPLFALTYIHLTLALPDKPQVLLALHAAHPLLKKGEESGKHLVVLDGELGARLKQQCSCL